MGNLCMGGLLAAGGLGFALAALVGGGKKPPAAGDDPIGYAIAQSNRKGRWPLFVFGLLFALFGVFIMVFW
jgi:hypothetical protein